MSVLVSAHPPQFTMQSATREATASARASVTSSRAANAAPSAATASSISDRISAPLLQVITHAPRCAPLSIGGSRRGYRYACKANGSRKRRVNHASCGHHVFRLSAASRMGRSAGASGWVSPCPTTVRAPYFHGIDALRLDGRAFARCNSPEAV